MKADTQEEIELQTYLNRTFTGAMTHYRKTPEKPRVGPRPPTWWIDDDDASQSSMTATKQMGGTSD